MDPRDFLQIATNLSNGSKPAEFRTAVSRAYYAAYHVGVGFLNGMDCHISEGSNGHAEVSRDLNNCGDHELSKVGSKINDLRSERIIADYKLNKTKYDDQRNTQATVMQAERIIKALDQYASSPRQIEIAKAIKEYRKKVSR
ncbi:MAG: hypothetical protein WC560_12025 [Syntrophales bacterium]